MRKSDEIALSNSCFNKAIYPEMIFVLLGRDAAAPETIREWVRQRLILKLNVLSDKQIQEALECAQTMELERVGK